LTPLKKESQQQGHEFNVFASSLDQDIPPVQFGFCNHFPPVRISLYIPVSSLLLLLPKLLKNNDTLISSKSDPITLPRLSP
jgi:hypothetical protein